MYICIHTRGRYVPIVYIRTRRYRENLMKIRIKIIACSLSMQYYTVAGYGSS